MAPLPGSKSETPPAGKRFTGLGDAIDEGLDRALQDSFGVTVPNEDPLPRPPTVEDSKTSNTLPFQKGRPPDVMSREVCFSAMNPGVNAGFRARVARPRSFLRGRGDTSCRQ